MTVSRIETAAAVTLKLNAAVWDEVDKVTSREFAIWHVTCDPIARRAGDCVQSQVKERSAYVR